MDVTGNPNIPLLVFAVCQAAGGAMLTIVPVIQRLSRDTTRDRKLSNIRLIMEDNGKSLLGTLKSKEPEICIENGMLSVSKLSPTRSLSGNIKV